MNAAIVRAFDAPPRYGEFAEPVAAEGERIVNVTAAGLHPIVKALASGTHYISTGQLPFIPGVDGVGRLQDGARVYFGMARRPFGTFSERAPAATSMYLPLPEGISDVTAAGIANPAMSSWVALTMRAKFVAGESVLILGATGAAGQLAIQIAKRLGARRVIACGRNPQTLEKLPDLGADATISLDQEHDALLSAFRSEFAEAGVDVVLDYLWGQPAQSALEAISQRGLRSASSRIRFIQIGASAGSTISLAAAVLRSSGVELLGSGFGSATLDQIWAALAEFFKAAVQEPFQFTPQTAPLRDIEKLWNSPQQGARLVFQP
jgi:NADPH:quinone reductase-like Zn-dependent oxidoreductase